MKEKRNDNYTQGIKAYRQNDYESARDHFDTVVSIDPEYKRAKYYLKRSEYFIKRKERKIERKNNVNYNRAIYYKKTKKYEIALDLFLRVQKEDPDYEDVDDQIDQCREKLAKRYDWRIKVAKSQYGRRQYIKAYSNALKASKINPYGSEAKSLKDDISGVLQNRTRAYRKRADYYFNRKLYSRAKDEAEKIIRMNPWNEYAADMKKKCNRMIAVDRDYKTGRKLFRKKNYFAARRTFRSVNSREKGYKYTEAYLKKIDRALAGSIGVYYRRGVYYYDREDFAKAIEQWNLVLSINPNHKQAAEYRDRAKAKLEIKQSLRK